MCQKNLYLNKNNSRSPEPDTRSYNHQTLPRQDSNENRRSQSEPRDQPRDQPQNEIPQNVKLTRSDSDEKLKAKRREWEEATAKRVHVVIRTRPLNIKEIKADCKVCTIQTVTKLNIYLTP